MLEKNICTTQTTYLVQKGGGEVMGKNLSSYITVFIFFLSLSFSNGCFCWLSEGARCCVRLYLRDWQGACSTEGLCMQEGTTLWLCSKNKYDIHPNFLLSHKRELFRSSFSGGFNLCKKILPSAVALLHLSFPAWVPYLVWQLCGLKLALCKRVLTIKHN